MANWDDYRYFSGLVQTGSVRGAAAQLGVNPSTVTRRLNALELRLGVKLFVRSQQGLTITPDGQAVMAELDQVISRLSEIELSLAQRSTEVAGLVRITMPDVFAVSLLMQEFARLGVAHPRIRLEFLPAYRALDLMRGEADIAIRITSSPPGDLVGRQLGRYRISVYGSRAYLAEHDPLAEPEACRWIESGLETLRAPALKGRYFAAMPLGPRCNNVLLQQAAVRSHMGVTLLPCAVGDADGELTRVQNVEPVDGGEIWLLFHPDLRGVVRIQTVSNFVQSAFEALSDRLLGI